VVTEGELWIRPVLCHGSRIYAQTAGSADEANVLESISVKKPELEIVLPWLHISPNSGNGWSTLHLVIDAASSTDVRTAYLMVESQAVTVVQSPRVDSVVSAATTRRARVRVLDEYEGGTDPTNCPPVSRAIQPGFQPEQLTKNIIHRLVAATPALNPNADFVAIGFDHKVVPQFDNLVLNFKTTFASLCFQSALAACDPGAGHIIFNSRGTRARIHAVARQRPRRPSSFDRRPLLQFVEPVQDDVEMAGAGVVLDHDE
jgi:hypothetical protein